MREPIYIPVAVKDAIAAHVISAVERARDGFYSAQEDEDVLTGHLGGVLRIGSQVVRVDQDEIRGDWKWSINYHKFRGRGKGAAEKLLGADGIFELTVDRGFRIEQKALLFQAKKNWDKDARLLRESIRLSTWREAAIVINFTPARYETYPLDDVIRAHGTKSAAGAAKDLGHTLGREFPNCLVGDTSLSYDTVRKRLIWRTLSGEIVRTEFAVGHKLKLKVESPKFGTHRQVDRTVPNDEVHNYRMAATDEEMLSVSAETSPTELKSRYAKMALAYHPDKFPDLEKLDKAILNRRMQEMNNARDALVKRRAASRRATSGR